MKKSLINLNPSSGVDVALSKLSVKERGKAMANGEMPDDWDYKNICNELDRFEHKHPGLITRMTDDAYKEIYASKIDKHAILSKDSEMQRAFWVPAEFMPWLEQAYPTLWANKKHARWFMRKFPMFSYEYLAKRAKV